MLFITYVQEYDLHVGDHVVICYFDLNGGNLWYF